jgi:hypothetical protein
MPINRSITNFVGAVHEMRAERRPEPIVLRGPSGGFNRQVILREAHRRARMLHCSGMPYRDKLALSLRSTWEMARKSGKPFSPSQVDRRWPRSRLLASANQGARA